MELKRSGVFILEPKALYSSVYCFESTPRSFPRKEKNGFVSEAKFNIVYPERKQEGWRLHLEQDAEYSSGFFSSSVNGKVQIMKKITNE